MVSWAVVFLVLRGLVLTHTLKHSLVWNSFCSTTGENEPLGYEETLEALYCGPPSTHLNTSSLTCPACEKLELPMVTQNPRPNPFPVPTAVPRPTPCWEKPYSLYPMPCTKYLKASASLAGCKRRERKCSQSPEVQLTQGHWEPGLWSPSLKSLAKDRNITCWQDENTKGEQRTGWL